MNFWLTRTRERLRVCLRLATCSLLALHLQTPSLASPAGVFVAASLLIGFGNYGGDGKVPASGIDGDEGEVGRAHMLAAVVYITFHPDFHSNFHGRAVHAIHRGAQDHQVADSHRNPEVEMINGGGHRVIARVPVR